MGGVAGDAGRVGPDIEAAVAAGEVHALLCAVAERTGDMSLLRDDLAPDQAQLLTPGWGLGPEQIAEARELAAAALAAHRRGGGARSPLDP